MNMQSSCHALLALAQHDCFGEDALVVEGRLRKSGSNAAAAAASPTAQGSQVVHDPSRCAPLSEAY
jgi:hypothetical protein